jgi:hypothetical protein
MLPRPNSAAVATAFGSDTGDTTKRAPSSATSRTWRAAVTVPAPMYASGAR